MEMNCTHQDFEDGVRVISLSGRMDIEGSERIALPFTVAARGGVRALVVDLAGVDFLASVGIGTLVSVAQAIQLQKGRMALCGAGEQVRRTLERTNITHLIPMYRDLEEARAAFAAPSAE
jgi:anti-anti-sigma factor